MKKKKRREWLKDALVLNVDDVHAFFMKNGIVCIPVESDGREMVLRMSPATLAKGLGMGTLLIASGEVLPFRKPSGNAA